MPSRTPVSFSSTERGRAASTLVRLVARGRETDWRKAASTVGPDNFRHLAERLGDEFIVGIVLHTGARTLSFGPKMPPVSALWEVSNA